MMFCIFSETSKRFLNYYFYQGLTWLDCLLRGVSSTVKVLILFFGSEGIGWNFLKIIFVVDYTFTFEKVKYRKWDVLFVKMLKEERTKIRFRKKVYCRTISILPRNHDMIRLFKKQGKQSLHSYPFNSIPSLLYFRVCHWGSVYGLFEN